MKKGQGNKQRTGDVPIVKTRNRTDRTSASADRKQAENARRRGAAESQSPCGREPGTATLSKWGCKTGLETRAFAPSFYEELGPWHPTPVLLPGKSHRQKSMVGCSPWGHKESDTTERLHFHFSLSCIGEGNGNPLQCSCLESPRDSRAWSAVIYGVAPQSWTRLK